MLYPALSASFCVIVLLSNVLSVKMVPVAGLAVPAGLLTYPLTFLLSGLVTEIFGTRRARQMIYTALGMNLLSLGMIQFGLWLPTDDAVKEVAFQAVLGLSGFRIVSSLSSYLVSQVVEVQLYGLIKRWTGSRWLWLRNNGATCASQLLDTVIVDVLFLGWGLAMPLADIWPVMVFSYLYKALFSFVCTPLFYLFVFTLRGQNGQLESGRRPPFGKGVSV